MPEYLDLMIRGPDIPFLGDPVNPILQLINNLIFLQQQVPEPSKFPRIGLNNVLQFLNPILILEYISLKLSNSFLKFALLFLKQLIIQIN